MVTVCIIVIILLSVFLCVTFGYAARQREELQEVHDQVGDLLVQNTDLLVQNANLKHVIKSNESVLEMVLDEVNK